ncbi:short-chain dehydrogenase [Stemphylium lycopersici]|uniref:Short-chain dehydrogenase n=1 Tax=Stemphylium lycopersici TaxID=183478 RepID=A0A364N1L5_STELY|nr:short-chain dehydrogenase [Stemphylium lycopersici]
MNTTSRFFTIPGEIGNQIYHLIVENRYVSLKSHNDDPSDPESASEQDQQEIAHASTSEFRRKYAYTVLSQIRRQLRKKLAIITGNLRSLGAMLALHLASKGANKFNKHTSYTSKAAAETLATELQKEHSVKTLLAKIDIMTADGPNRLIEATQSAFGTDQRMRIDILINNAGIVNFAPMGAVTLDQFEAIFQLNARVPLFVLQAAIPHLPN